MTHNMTHTYDTQYTQTHMTQNTHMHTYMTRVYTQSAQDKNVTAVVPACSISTNNVHETLASQ